MSWREDLENVFLNMVTFGGYGIGRLIGESGHDSQSVQGNIVAGQGGRSHITPPAPSRPRSANPSAGLSGSEGCGCCDRFQLTNGYLVDGATGVVWRLNAKGDVLEEVPRANSSDDLKKALLEEEIAKLKAKYEDEALYALTQAERAKQLAAFEKRYLQPLRKAVLSR